MTHSIGFNAPYQLTADKIANSTESARVGEKVCRPAPIFRQIEQNCDKSPLLSIPIYRKARKNLKDYLYIRSEQSI